MTLFHREVLMDGNTHWWLLVVFFCVGIKVLEVFWALLANFLFLVSRIDWKNWSCFYFSFYFRRFCNYHGRFCNSYPVLFEKILGRSRTLGFVILQIW